MPKYEDKEFVCSFCGKTSEEAGQLVAGPGVFICDECIEICYDMLNKNEISVKKAKKEDKEKEFVLPTPKEIKEKLDDYVIGQDEAEKLQGRYTSNRLTITTFSLAVQICICTMQTKATVVRDGS